MNRTAKSWGAGVFFVLGTTGAAVTPAGAADLERGKALHDTFCILCHSTDVYTRPDRIANTYIEIRQQVQRWQGNTQRRWSSSDIDSVTDYLAERYYRLP